MSQKPIIEAPKQAPSFTFDGTTTFTPTHQFGFKHIPSAFSTKPKEEKPRFDFSGFKKNDKPKEKPTFGQQETLFKKPKIDIKPIIPHSNAFKKEFTAPTFKEKAQEGEEIKNVMTALKEISNEEKTPKEIYEQARDFVKESNEAELPDDNDFLNEEEETPKEEDIILPDDWSDLEKEIDEELERNRKRKEETIYAPPPPEIPETPELKKAIEEIEQETKEIAAPDVDPVEINDEKEKVKERYVMVSVQFVPYNLHDVVFMKKQKILVN